ncbi:MAG: acyl-CoA synthetase [Acidimicrobiales bacterium]
MSDTTGTLTDWNIADAFEAIAARIGDRPCQVQGDRTVTWGEFDRRAEAVAADLIDAGLGRGAKVACYLYNGPEYMEVVNAAFKASMSPVNTNYRYGGDEVVYLFDNADAEAIVFHAVFTDLIDEIRDRLPKVKRWYLVDDDTANGEVPDWATPYEAVATSGAHLPEEVRAGRSGDDLLLLYTGGTTGMPKGVMWRQDDLFNVLGAGANPFLGTEPVASLDELADRAATAAAPPVMVVACPLMHGTGQFSALISMIGGGTVVSLPSRQFSVEELFDTIVANRATNVVIVGQAFAGPMLTALDAEPDRWDLSSLVVISSSGVMWSQQNKQGLLGHIPQVLLYDSFGSSEAVGLGSSVSANGLEQETARFEVTENNAVFMEDGTRVEPGSEEIGQIAVGGFIPVGYYKDEEKSAATFRTYEGRRWSIPGDYAQVNADGTIRLLGRGSVCINTGGEKVFPEEVEEALKTHGSVRDAVVVGVPDDRFGETVCGVVEANDGASIDPGELRDHVSTALAAYKAPRNVVVVDSISRAANGKVDYKRLRQVAIDEVGARG